MGETEFYIYELCWLFFTVEVVLVCWLSWPHLGRDQFSCRYIGPMHRPLPSMIGDRWIAVRWWDM